MNEKEDKLIQHYGLQDGGEWDREQVKKVESVASSWV